MLLSKGGLQAAEQPERKVLVEEDDHDALTNGGRQMSGDVSSVAESRSHLFNRERVFVGDGLHRLPGGDGSNKRDDIDQGSGDARLAEPDVRVH